MLQVHRLEKGISKVHLNISCHLGNRTARNDTSSPQAWVKLNMCQSTELLKKDSTPLTNLDNYHIRLLTYFSG